MLQLFSSKQIFSMIERLALIWKEYVIKSNKFVIFKNIKIANILLIAKTIWSFEDRKIFTISKILAIYTYSIYIFHIYFTLYIFYINIYIYIYIISYIKYYNISNINILYYYNIYFLYILFYIHFIYILYIYIYFIYIYIYIYILYIYIFFFLHIQFTRFETKRLQSPGAYISRRTWDPNQKAITK